MKSRVVSVFSRGWFVVVAGFLLFNVAAANAQAPTIASVAPSSRPAGGPAFSLTVTGTNLNSSSVVRWNGSDRVTTLMHSRDAGGRDHGAGHSRSGNSPGNCFQSRTRGRTNFEFRHVHNHW